MGLNSKKGALGSQGGTTSKSAWADVRAAAAVRRAYRALNALTDEELRVIVEAGPDADFNRWYDARMILESRMER